MSVSGGQPTLRYFFAANGDQQIGAVGIPDTVLMLMRKFDKSARIPDELKRPNTQGLFDLRTNINAGIGSRLDLLLSAGYTRSNTRNITLSYQAFTDAMTARDTSTIWSASLASAGAQIKEVTNRFTTSINANANLTSWLTARGTMGLDASSPVRNAVSDRPRDWIVKGGGNASDARGLQQMTTLNLGVTATNEYEPVRFRTTMGGQFVRSLVDMVTVYGFGLPPHATSVQRTAQKFVSPIYSQTAALGGYFEETVSFLDRIFLTGALRADGASSFGKGFSATAYPKFSASWVVSQEPFMAGIRGIDDLRLRAAFGVAGRHPQPRAADPVYELLGENIPGIGPGRVVSLFDLGNPELRPERGQEFEAGFDVGFFERRVQLEFTRYGRRTSDQIVSLPLPVGLGGGQGNLGLTTEQGTEAKLSGVIIDTRPLSWTVTLERSNHATKLVDIGRLRGSRLGDGGYVEGYPLGARFTAVIEKFADENGDGVISADEITLSDSAVYVGENSTPRTMTISTSVGVLQNRVRFTALLDRQSGLTLIDGFFGCFGCRERNDVTTPLATQAAFVAKEMFRPGKPSVQIVDRGDFTRLREVTAAVTLPVRLVQRAGVSSGSISLSARNLGLWSKFSGTDPESGGLPGRVLRDRSGAIPQNRTFVLRCDFSL